MTANHTKCNQKQPEVSTFCNLTEKWKKGELESGLYYVEATNGDTYVDEFTWSLYADGDYYGGWEHSDDNEIEKVLMKVPLYDEVFSMESNDDFQKQRISTLESKNQKLKDIISKMCMELVDPDDDMSNGLAEYFNQDLLLEIHEVLK